MKYVFSFLVFLAVISISAEMVWKLVDLSAEKSLVLADEEDSDEPEEEQGDEEQKVKLKEHEWMCFAGLADETTLVVQALSESICPGPKLIDQHTSAVPYSPPEMM